MKKYEGVMDLVLKLREIRRKRGLSQKDVAKMSGVGEKTISSFETGQRIDSLKLAQLRRLLKVYGLTEAQFFGGTVEKEIAPWELDSDEFATSRIVDNLSLMPAPVKKTLLANWLKDSIRNNARSRSWRRLRPTKLLPAILARPNFSIRSVSKLRNYQPRRKNCL